MRPERAAKPRMLDQSGFNLVELIVVVVIVGVLSIYAAAKFEVSTSRLQPNTVIKKIAADLRLAQQLALTEGQGTSVYIDQSNNRYYLKWADGNYVEKLVGGGDFIVQLGTGDFHSVYITESQLVNGRLDFQTNGRPLNGGLTFSGQLNIVTLNNAPKLLIAANTGFLSIDDL